MADNGSDDTKDQISPSLEIVNNDSSADELAREVEETLTLSQRHQFWETQPVGHFKDLRDTTLPEGVIEPPTLISEVKQEPYNLPGPYEWVTCDMGSEETCAEVYNLLTNNYVEDNENMFRFNYSKEFLRWALHPPGCYKIWHIGVRVKSSKKLVAFITGIPAKIRVRSDVVSMAEVNFLCVHKKLRLGPRMTMSRTLKLYKLPDSTVTPGFRKMEFRDVPAVTRLVRTYLLQFVVAPDLDERDVEHWILPKEGVVDSFVIESPETREITDFCSFYTLPSSILGHPT
nr:glycylpeptide N-tetradecanoyltransferase 1-like [Tanacetum cinerariifolium]GEY58635.1 glycylpeptide N-tetradecanoyltransferase 1-like [Tanacetum cinerariifolium]